MEVAFAVFRHLSRESFGCARAADALTYFCFHVYIYFYLRVCKSP